MIDSTVPAGQTAVPPDQHGAGFPPFKTESFPSQIFWLVITMTVLFMVLWRFAGPRIKGTLAERRDLIARDIETAQESRRKAEQATVAYETPLFEARERARAINNQYREQASAGVKKAEAEADLHAEKATAEAEARLNTIRAEAKSHIVQAAQDATIEIVARLTGERISGEDAAARRARNPGRLTMELLKETDFWEGLGLVIVIALILYRRVPAMLGQDARRARGRDPERTHPGQAAARGGRSHPRALHRTRQPRAGRSRNHPARCQGRSRTFRPRIRDPVEGAGRTARPHGAGPHRPCEAQALAEIRALAAMPQSPPPARSSPNGSTNSNATALIDSGIRDLAGKLN